MYEGNSWAYIQSRGLWVEKNKTMIYRCIITVAIDPTAVIDPIVSQLLLLGDYVSYFLK